MVFPCKPTHAVYMSVRPTTCPVLLMSPSVTYVLYQDILAVVLQSITLLYNSSNIAGQHLVTIMALKGEVRANYIEYIENTLDS